MILIVGSTGLLGGLVTNKLVQAGLKAVAFVRDRSSEKAKSLEAAGAQIVTGDLKDRASTEEAVRGASAIVCTACATLSRREGDSIETVDVAGVQSLIEIAAKSGVQRFVFISVSPNMGDDFPLASAKRAAEACLRASGLDHVILQPSFFPEIWFSPAAGFDSDAGTVRVYGDGEAKVSYIAANDVASTTVSALNLPGRVTQTVPIGGPEPISQLSAISMAERACGRQLQISSMPLDQIRVQRSVTEDPLQASYLGMFEHLALGDEIPTAWTELLAVRPLAMEEWFERKFSNVSGDGEGRTASSLP